MFRREPSADGGREFHEGNQHYFDCTIYIDGEKVFQVEDLTSPEDAKQTVRRNISLMMNKNSNKNRLAEGVVDEVVYDQDNKVSKSRVFWNCTNQNLEGQELNQDFKS